MYTLITWSILSQKSNTSNFPTYCQYLLYTCLQTQAFNMLEHAQSCWAAGRGQRSSWDESAGNSVPWKLGQSISKEKASVSQEKSNSPKILVKILKEHKQNLPPHPLSSHQCKLNISTENNIHQGSQDNKEVQSTWNCLHKGKISLLMACPMNTSTKRKVINQQRWNLIPL